MWRLADFLRQSNAPVSDTTSPIPLATLLTLFVGAILPFAGRIWGAFTGLIEGAKASVDARNQERTTKIDAFQTVIDQNRLQYEEIQRLHQRADEREQLHDKQVTQFTEALRLFNQERGEWDKDRAKMMETIQTQNAALEALGEQIQKLKLEKSEVERDRDYWKGEAERLSLELAKHSTGEVAAVVASETMMTTAKVENPPDAPSAQ